VPIWLPELTADPEFFPDPQQALTDPDGLLALGGDLSASRLIHAYRLGIFPWFNEGDPLLWWSPSVRAIFAPKTLQLSRTLKKTLKKHNFSFSCNQQFSEVMQLCAQTRLNTTGTWIQPSMQQAYGELHRLGVANSIEVWLDNQLVGGCYGLQIGHLFCGESMFNLVPNAAKLALVALQHQLSQYTDGLIDCQMPNPFLMQLGAQPLPRSEYLSLLAERRDAPLPATMWAARSLLIADEGQC
jgi:leucyl/phenylalanyl-tRNA--protein transferase